MVSSRLPSLADTPKARAPTSIWMTVASTMPLCRAGWVKPGSAHTSSLTAAAGFLPSSGVLACVGAPVKCSVIPVETQCMVPSRRNTVPFASPGIL